jgi:hypothetical protein
MQTKHVLVLEINEEQCVQIKNTYYSCMYLTCILYYLNKLNLKCFFFNVLLRNKWSAWLIRGCRVLKKIRYVSLSVTLPTPQITLPLNRHGTHKFVPTTVPIIL